MTGTSGGPPPSCATPYCACGRCYSPRSVVGDWLRPRALRLAAGFRRVVLRRRERFPRDPRGGVALPAWVGELVADLDLLDDGA